MKRCQAPDCVAGLESEHPRAKYCSNACRQRASRARKAAARHAEAEAQTDTRGEHGLVRAVRMELDEAGVLMTFKGQLALQTARRLANPDESGFASLSKDLRAVMAEALAGSTPTPGGGDADGDSRPDEEEDDEVTRARKARAEARQAAGLS